MPGARSAPPPQGGAGVRDRRECIMASPFRPANELMVQYATYHRDRRNIATHFFGIPLIVFAIGVFLARAQFTLGSLQFTAAEVLWLATTVWYLTRGNFL